MRSWRPEAIDTLFSHRLFSLERHRLRALDDPSNGAGREEAGPSADRREALVLRAPDWVNVVPLLPDGRVVLIRQWRYGVAAPTLEIPGGMVEGEDPRAAAERELLEETGYRAGRWERLGELHPNPAFIANRLVTWLATDLERVAEPEGDGEEEITVETAPLASIPDLVARGDITHSLVVSAFYLLSLRRPALGDGRGGEGESRRGSGRGSRPPLEPDGEGRRPDER